MNLKDIKELIRYFEKASITELEVEEGESRIYLSKNGVTPSQLSAPVLSVPTQVLPNAAPEKPSVKEQGTYVESPIIGTYYSSSTPGGNPYVKTGDVVEKGDTLCIIEAMKIMNALEAEYRMKILRVLVDNASPVEYGQPIFLVEAL